MTQFLITERNVYENKRMNGNPFLRWQENGLSGGHRSLARLDYSQDFSSTGVAGFDVSTGVEGTDSLMGGVRENVLRVGITFPSETMST